MPKGFYKVSVVAPSMDIPVLPYRTSNGKLIFPIGEWEGTYYSDELLLAKDHGYTITPIEAVVFSESRDFLHKYVDEFTRVKELGGAYRPIGKLFINSLYGRFGFRQNNEVTVIIDNHMVNYYSNRYDIIDNVAIGKFTLLTYISKPVLQYYKDSNLFSEYAKDMRRFKREFRYTESNVALAAAITALGRIHLYNDICSVQKHGGQVAYCDTDSIYAYFTSSPLGQWHGGVY